MATNSIIARGGVIHVPPISLAFYRWFFVFLILLPFTINSILENRNYLLRESKQLFFLGFMGCGICGAFPFLAGLTTTVTNIGIIYTSSPIFIILISSVFFKEKNQHRENEIKLQLINKQGLQEDLGKIVVKLSIIPKSPHEKIEVSVLS